MKEVDAQAYLDENNGLLMKLANKFYLDTPKFSMDDLVQEASLAATRALQKFDPSKEEAKISTYVYTAANRGLRDFVRRNKHDLYVSGYQQNKDFQERIKKGPSSDDGAKPKEKFGAKQSPIALRLDVASGSPNNTGTEGENETMGDTIPSGELSPIEDMIKQEQIDILREEVDALPRRERQVIRENFFEGRSLADIAREQKVTRQRIEQISKRAMGRLKDKIIRRLDGNLFV